MKLTRNDIKQKRAELVEVYATTDLLDMANSDPADWPHRVNLSYDATTGTWHPADGILRPAMFFKWRISPKQE